MYVVHMYVISCLHARAAGTPTASMAMRRGSNGRRKSGTTQTTRLSSWLTARAW